jgi:hypothetical protein
MSKRLKPVPNFANEAKERKFWETHDSADYVDWSKAKRTVLPNPKPTTNTLSAPAATFARCHQGGSKCTGRALSVADQGVVAGEGGQQ